PSDTYTLSLHDALPISSGDTVSREQSRVVGHRWERRFLTWKCRCIIKQILIPPFWRSLMADVGAELLDFALHSAVHLETRHLERDRKSTRLNSSHDQIS